MLDTAPIDETVLDPYKEPMVHCYPRDPRYRLSGSIPNPQPGDIAYCGHRKKLPHRDGHWSLNCVVCIDLKRAHETI